MALQGRQWWWVSGAVVVAAAASAASLWVFGTGSDPSVAGTQAYTSVKSCLLTGEQGIGVPPASQAWAGMRDASARTRAQASYLAVPGPEGTANAQPFLGSLLARRCAVVVTTGTAGRTAVLSVADQYPKVRFVLVTDGAAGPVAAPNVSLVPAGRPGLRAAVAGVVGVDEGSVPAG